MKKDKTGHRERLREGFLTGDPKSLTEEALLELLLTYAIPQKDLKLLSQKLITQFGGLSNILSQDIKTLCETEGIKTYSAILLKVADWIRSNYSKQISPKIPNRIFDSQQQRLFADTPDEIIPIEKHLKKQIRPKPRIIPRRGTQLFGKAVLKEAIALLPLLPDTESLDELRDFLRKNLHFNAEQTRRRYANYIIRRMFPEGFADNALREFSKNYKDLQELRDVCFYRFCLAESLMFDILKDLILTAIGVGKISREQIRTYLTSV